MYGKHRADLEAEQQEQAYMQGQQSAMAAAPPQAAPPSPATAAGVSASDVSRLQELGKLHEQGILTDEEFARQKTLILGG
jgi:hypothetical protein